MAAFSLLGTSFRMCHHFLPILGLSSRCARLNPPVMGFSSKVASVSNVTGMLPGPFPVGVTTVQLNDWSRKDPSSKGPRRLQTEIWYPAGDEALSLPKNLYSDFLGRGAIPGSIEAAEEPDAIGGYKAGLTIADLDASWQNSAVRDARPHPVGLGSKGGRGPWPLVLFSHGSGAFRASYIYFTEFLASHGFVVAACDHLGSARYSQVDGEVVKPGGARSTPEQMEFDRPKDLLFLIDALARFNSGADSRFAGRIDTSNCAVTGMSFGGWAAAAALEKRDPRIKAAICKCPSFESSRGNLPSQRNNHETPLMMMLAQEDVIIGAKGNDLCRTYFASHDGPKCLLEIKAAGHVSFTSCELYNADYGNGIGESQSLTKPGCTYVPLSPVEQHTIINTYALAFLNIHLRPHISDVTENLKLLQENFFGEKIVHKFEKAKEKEEQVEEQEENKTDKNK